MGEGALFTPCIYEWSIKDSIDYTDCISNNRTYIFIHVIRIRKAAGFDLIFNTRPFQTLYNMIVSTGQPPPVDSVSFSLPPLASGTSACGSSWRV